MSMGWISSTTYVLLLSLSPGFLMTWCALALPLTSYRLARNFRASIGQSGFNQPVLKLYRHLELAQGFLRGSDGISVTHAYTS